MNNSADNFADIPQEIIEFLAGLQPLMKIMHEKFHSVGGNVIVENNGVAVTFVFPSPAFTISAEAFLTSKLGAPGSPNTMICHKSEMKLSWHEAISP